MKTKLFLILISFFCSVNFFPMSPDKDKTTDKITELTDRAKEADRRDKIAISRTGGTTRSASDILLDVSTDNKTEVTVSVMDFTGLVVVQITGGRTSAQYCFDVYDMGFDIINIGTLRSGTYNIRIILGNEVYDGVFEKVTVGR